MEAQETMYQLSELVDFQARLHLDIAKLAKAHVRSTDADGYIRLRLSGQLHVEELYLDDKALTLPADELAQRLADVLDDALQKAHQLALSRLSATDEGDSLGLPTKRPTVGTLKHQDQ